MGTRVAVNEAFHAWAAQFEWLSDVETMELPAWQQPIAFIYQFVLDVQGDGAGSLFYNHTENIENVASAFEVIDEPEYASQIRRINAILEPLVENGPADMQSILVSACMDGPATEEVLALEAAVNARLMDIYGKLEATAKANGWTS